MEKEIAPLQLCNLVSRGMTLAEAREKLAEKAGTTPQVDEPKKKSAAEKKAALRAEIESLGGEAPGEAASVAKFQESLTAAKAAIVKKEQDEADAAQKVADAAQKVADAEQAEADAAAQGLM